MEKIHTKKTSPERAGDNVQSSQSTNKLVSRQESFSQVFDENIFEVSGGMVNLTKMASSFGKEIRRWLQNPNTKKFISSLEAVDGKSVIAILQGGNGEQGTFGTRDIAIKVAQWISPDFEVFCIKKLDTLFQTGKVELAPEPKKQEIDSDFLFQLAKKMRELEFEKEKLALQNKRLIHSGKTYTATEIAKELNLKSAIQLNKILENSKIQYKVNNTWVLYADLADKGFTEIKQIELDNGKIVYDRVFTGNGRDWILENQTKMLSKQLVVA